MGVGRQGVSFVELLGTNSGTFVYHLLVIMALQAMAGIALIEWRHTRNPDHRRVLIAFGGLLGLRIPLLIGEPLTGQSFTLNILSPLLSGMEMASIVILGWAFLAHTLSRRAGRRYLFGGLGIAFLCTVTFLPPWYRALQRFPNLLYVAFWQPAFWNGIGVMLALSLAVLLLSRQSQERPWLPVIGFLTLSLGSLALLASSLLQVVGRLEAANAATMIGWGRVVSLIGYPFFAIAVYRTALQDMWAYRQELQVVSEEALRQTQELFFLVEASRITGESLDLNTILHKVVESIALALNADRCAVFLINSDRPDTITLAAQYTTLQRAERTVAHELSLADQPTLDYALQRRKQLILNVKTDNPRLRALYGSLGSQRAGPVIVQPLLRQRRVLGVLVVGNDHGQRPFDANNGRLCQSISVQIAAAIENARLYRDLQVQAGKLAELLRAQEDEVRRRTAILESVAEGVIVSDKEGRIVVVNAAAERILGAPRQRIVGHLLKRLTGHTVLDPTADWGLVAQVDAPLQTVFELENKVVHVSSAPVLTPAGDHLGIVAILRDITRESEAKRAKSEFITTISHELRTPLTAIRGYAETLTSGMVGPTSESQAHFLKIIRDNALHMVGLTENLIAVADLEKGGLKLEYGEADLYLIVGEVLRLFQSQVDARQLQVKLELEDGLPPIEADAARMRQILDNLLSNAVRFTYPGGRITVGARLLCDDAGQMPTHCAIWVADTGIGVPVEEQAHIWERFYRPANPLAAEAGGLGVGLSIVKSLVEAHGGRAWLESAPGVGSTFTVLLPVRRAADR
jgi:PAS domain S-box-containing protein